MAPPFLNSIDALQAALADHGYFSERSLTTAIFLALKLGRPLFLEGEAGVGKTEVAKVLASLLDTRLIRLQCYEGLDVSSAVYEWNYPRQMLQIRLLEATGAVDVSSAQHDLFSPDYLLKRPLLQALESHDGKAPVLLIDELDRADEEFEAFLLEVLSDFQVTVPEIGPIRVKSMTRSSGAASTTGSTILPSTRNTASSWPKRRRRRSGWRARSSPSCRNCAAPICTSCPAWPRRWTGSRRWWRSTRLR